MAQDHGFCRKKGKGVNNETAHGPPLQARVAAANGTVLAACKHVEPILAHMEMNRAKQNEQNGGKTK